MTKTEMRSVAKDVLIDTLAVAYYKLENMDFSQEEQEEISSYINQYGESMAKAIGRKYFTM
jgi:hypothetical protein